MTGTPWSTADDNEIHVVLEQDADDSEEVRRRIGHGEDQLRHACGFGVHSFGLAWTSLSRSLVLRIVLVSGRPILLLLLATFTGSCVSPSSAAQLSSAPREHEWRSYGADLASTRYAPLDQINASNFEELEIAWRLKTDFLGPRPEYMFQSTPLMSQYPELGSPR